MKRQLSYETRLRMMGPRGPRSPEEREAKSRRQTGKKHPNGNGLLGVKRGPYKPRVKKCLNSSTDCVRICHGIE